MSGRQAKSPLVLGLATVIAVSASVLYPSGVNAQSPELGEASGPSIQYREALSHASQKFDFTPGGTVTVPFRPRVGDKEIVDGAAPVALPAAPGTSTAEPSLTGTPAVAQSAALLRREVYGFLPYWALGTTLDYDTLSTIAYFSIDLTANLNNANDPAIGTLDKTGNDWAGWTSTTMTNVINQAHAHGTRVALTIAAFAWDTNGRRMQEQIMSTDVIRHRTAQSIVDEVVRRGVDGVNLDFEPIAPGPSYANFVAFVKILRADLDAAHPGYELVFCANGSGGSYDLANLLAPGGADAVFIMAYDLRGGTPATTGSIDPIDGSNNYTLTSIVNYFTSHGAPASKILLGLPWYGHAWSTGTLNTVNAPPADIPTYGAPATGVTYATAASLASQEPATTSCAASYPVPCVNGWQYDPVEETAWTAYYGNYGGTSNTWRELYFDDPLALARKISSIEAWNLRGLGIWALGYDNNNGDGDLTATVALMLEGIPSTYTPVTPTRIADSRTSLALGLLHSGVAQTFQVAGQNGIPDTATAVTGNLTVTQQTAAGYLYLGPVAVNAPSTSTLNFPKGDDRANNVTVALDWSGGLSVTYSSTTAGATTQAVFDVTGYFTPDTNGATFTPLTPTRVLDSRNGTGGLAGPFSSHVARTFTVWGNGGVPTGATAITGNLTVTQQTSLGYLYVGPIPADNPTSSTLNFPKGDDRANGVTVALSPTGTLSVTYAAPTLGPTAHVVFDVTGYFMQGSSGAMYVPITPSRIMDSRTGNGYTGAFRSHVAQAFTVWGRGGVPSEATAVTGNLTVTQQTSPGFLYLGPNPINDPTSSTLNFPTGDDRANGVTVAIDTSVGRLCITYAAPTLPPTTHAVFDVTGYFVPVR